MSISKQKKALFTDRIFSEGFEFRNLEFGIDLDKVNFKIKSTSKDNFCPKYFFAFMNQGVTFKSSIMFHDYDGYKNGRNTNEKNHVATRTQEKIELPQAGWIHG